MADLLAEDMLHVSNGACVDDTTPPTFAGIATILARANGSIRATWLAATDPTTPIRYDIYIQASTATGLFSSGNLVASTRNLTVDVYTLGDGLTNLVAGTTYYVGVRARDAVGNVDSNVVSLSAVSTGVLSDSLATIATTLANVIDNAANLAGGLLIEAPNNAGVMEAVSNPTGELIAKDETETI